MMIRTDAALQLLPLSPYGYGVPALHVGHMHDGRCGWRKLPSPEEQRPIDRSVRISINRGIELRLVQDGQRIAAF